MPVNHQIDTDHKIIITEWTGRVDDNQVIEVLIDYHREIKSKHEFFGYNELLVFIDVGPLELSEEGLRKLAEKATGFDEHSGVNKLAIVVESLLGFGLARMYEIFRSFMSTNGKEVHVFREREEAFKWLTS